MLERLSGAAPRDQALAWLAVLPYLIDAFALGQTDPINLFLVTSGLVLARDSRGVIGAGLIGIAGMLKVLPVAFWAVLAARRRLGAALAGAVATVLLSLALLTAAVGWRPAVAGVGEWIQVLHEQEGPWGLVATRNSLRENNEALAIVLARTLGDLDPDLTRNAVHLAHAPLPVIWAAWLAMLAVLGAIWLACARRSRAMRGERAWLGLFALTAVVMLVATHIAWPHYFLWLLPAALFLADRRRLLVAMFALGQLGMMVPILRGLGIHMAIALVLFGVVAREISGSPTARAQRGGP
jgi:alpha-1,2-mannosyltransferase